MRKTLLQCTDCPRLAEHLAVLRQEFPGYHNQPVLPFGVEDPSLLIVGLAPGKHGANASGRPFTGDYAGILLYQTLFDAGFSNQATGENADDGLELYHCRISNAVKCLPPENKPTTAEIKTCNHYLQAELNQLLSAKPDNHLVLALGGIAHQAVLRACNQPLSSRKFAHNTLHELDNGLRLLNAYHCSRYNTQTRRLTPDMFRQVFEHAHTLLKIT
ncbi:uracil-DNA glycosylase [Candidatus Venteria ishoeyi]|uniref:uracil-DNA glycosylase n=1 Tax=Candidatus Venteria ishoeyi TaxID=1899563 RepID=UPI0025A553B3|nr:uracil-DNA glycosylase [Candidatus Venteria ishoeyi]MDM8547421.1 uracil-DNA glycosylase [Candidatus Venteria ishoeyi]